jgi:dihydrofolate reductase
MTRVHTTLEGDTWFPEIKEDEWELITSLSFDKDEKHAYSYTFETWQRK